MKKAAQNFHTYPLILLAMLAFSCVFLIYWSKFSGIVLGVCTILFSLVFLLKKRKICRFSIYAIILLLCILRTFYSFHITDQKLLQYADQTISATVRINKVTNDNLYYQEYQVTFLECNQQPISTGKGILSYNGPEVYQVGTVLKGSFQASLPPEYNYGFANRIYQFSQRILIYLEVSDEKALSITQEEPSFSLHAIDLLRDRMTMRLLRWDKNTAALSEALILGEKSALPSDIRTDFTKIGASHILAISGMHLSVLTALLYFLLKRFRFPRFLRILFLLFSICFCVCLTGFTPSVLRAASLTAVGLLFSLCNRRISSISLLAFVGLLFVLFLPHLLFHVGFLLSYFATLGILVVNIDPKEKSVLKNPIHSLGRNIWTLAFLSLTAILFTLPLSAIFFREINFFGIISSLFLVPLCTLSICASLLFILLPDFLFSFSLFPYLLSLPLKMMLWCTKQLARIPIPTFVPSTSLLWIFLIPFIIVLFIYLLKHPQKKKLFTLFLLCICLIQWQVQFFSQLTKEDCLKLRLYHEKTAEVLYASDLETHILIDVQEGTYSLLQEAIADCTRYDHISIPDALVITQYRNELPKILSYFLANERMPHIYIPTSKTAEEQVVATQLEDLCLQFSLSLHYYDTSFSINALQFHIYSESDLLLQKDTITIAHFPANWNQMQTTAERFQSLRKTATVSCYLFAPKATLPIASPLSGQYVAVNDSLPNAWQAEFPLLEKGIA